MGEPILIGWKWLLTAVPSAMENRRIISINGVVKCVICPLLGCRIEHRPGARENIIRLRKIWCLLRENMMSRTRDFVLRGVWCRQVVRYRRRRGCWRSRGGGVFGA